MKEQEYQRTKNKDKIEDKNSIVQGKKKPRPYLLKNSKQKTLITKAQTWVNERTRLPKNRNNEEERKE